MTHCDKCGHVIEEGKVRLVHMISQRGDALHGINRDLCPSCFEALTMFLHEDMRGNINMRVLTMSVTYATPTLSIDRTAP